MCAPHGHPKRLEGSTNQGGRIGPERYFSSSPPGADLWLQGGTPKLILVGFRGNNFPVLGMERTQPPASSCQDHWGYFYPLFLKSHFSAAQGAAEEHQTSFPPGGETYPRALGFTASPCVEPGEAAPPRTHSWHEAAGPRCEAERGKIGSTPKSCGKAAAHRGSEREPRRCQGWQRARPRGDIRERGDAAFAWAGRESPPPWCDCWLWSGALQAGGRFWVPAANGSSPRASARLLQPALVFELPKGGCAEPSPIPSPHSLCSGFNHPPPGAPQGCSCWERGWLQAGCWRRLPWGIAESRTKDGHLPLLLLPPF